MSVRISSKLARVVRLVARGLAGRDAAQLALVGERLEFLVGRAPGGVGLFADPVDRPRFAQRLGDCSNTVAGAHRLSPRLDPISRGFGHAWHLLIQCWRCTPKYVCTLLDNREFVASEGVRTLKCETDRSYEPTDAQQIFRL